MTVDKLWKSLQFLVIWSQIASMPSSTNNSFLINNKFTPGISCNIQSTRESTVTQYITCITYFLKNIMQQDNIKHLGEEIDKIQRRCKCKPNTRWHYNYEKVHQFNQSARLEFSEKVTRKPP